MACSTPQQSAPKTGETSDSEPNNSENASSDAPDTSHAASTAETTVSAKAFERTLREMFPALRPEEARRLAQSSESADQIITRILDNNIEQPVIPASEIRATPRARACPPRELNFPRVFATRRELAANGLASLPAPTEVTAWRSTACALQERAVESARLAHTHRLVPARSHFSSQAAALSEDAAAWHRAAAEATLRRALETPGPIDLHGLRVAEASAFVEDLIRIRPGRVLRFATGRVHNSQRLRPALTELLSRRGYTVADEGPVLVARPRFPPV